MPGRRLLRGAGPAQQVVVDELAKPYRYRGIPGWDPAAVPAPRASREAPRLPRGQARQRAGERMAEFGRLRAAGVDPATAGTLVGVSGSHARKYEQRRKRALAEAAVPVRAVAASPPAQCGACGCPVSAVRHLAECEPEALDRRLRELASVIGGGRRPKLTLVKGAAA
jgi:hypothetical protein